MNFTFDVDGTLTPSRRQMDPSFQAWFIIFSCKHPVYLVTGRDREKPIDQVGLDVYNRAQRVYNCSGSDVWEGDRNVYSDKWTLPHDVNAWLMSELRQSNFTIRTGTHIERRPGCVNFSILGRGANQTERLVYSDWDDIKKEREGIATRFNEKFPELHALVGGMTGVDISTKGSDKSQIIRDFSDGDVVFFGDRLDPHGNDRPLADAIEKNKLGMVVEVTGWEDTWNKLT